MFGGKDPVTGESRLAQLELLRLAIPRRVYTKSHIDYVIETAGRVAESSTDLPGLRITKEASHLRHFTARLEPMERVEEPEFSATE